jgi:aubergine-like protein
MNAKLGGISYVADIKNKDFMVVGVNSSRYKGKRTGVAMTATINDTYTDFYNKEEIIEEEHYKDRLQFCVSSFVEEALGAYKENNEDYELKGIIIYRQGVSLQQKNFLSNEIKTIEDLCKKKKIKFYYILVNTKTTFKFFDVEDNKYYNPYSGLLVIEGITNKNFFEFYIQPQEVTQGSATPTCFHVAYGDLDMPEMIPKFTFDLCHLYSNWQGPVRIPNVLKAAEKLSKMTAKYKLGELNENLKYGQAYL